MPPLCCHPRTKRSGVKDLHTRGVPDLMRILFKTYRMQKIAIARCDLQITDTAALFSQGTLRVDGRRGRISRPETEGGKVNAVSSECF